MSSSTSTVLKYPWKGTQREIDLSKVNFFVRVALETVVAIVIFLAILFYYGTSPIWFPLHYILRLMGRRGFMKREENYSETVFSTDAFKKR